MTHIWYIVWVHYRKDRTYTMNFKQIAKNMLKDTSIYFTLITAAYAALMMVVNVDVEEPAIRASWLLYIFLFSVLGAISQCIFRIEAMNKALRIAIQYAILLFGSCFCFFMPLSFSGSQVMIGLTIVTLLYAVIISAYLFFSYRFKKLSRKEEVYESKFKKLK